MKFTIDRSKWRCGGWGKHRMGRGEVRMQNVEGFQCCLGQMACQLGATKGIVEAGFPDSECMEPSFPKMANILIRADEAAMTDFARGCADLNDDAELPADLRESRLQVHAAEHGHELEFVGEYVR